eukprot:GFUD01139848.1.p1 GENE.GFUD01139848.1~~GFUD01139848.1.p1  ORF type:complete len:319 (-),score=12.61 GFUD01139848.1:27-956(-)
MFKLLLMIISLAILNEVKTLESPLEVWEFPLEDYFMPLPFPPSPSTSPLLGTARQHGCPSLDEIPVVNDRKQFYGIRTYYGKGNSVPELSCNGDINDGVAGYKHSAAVGKATYMGTLFVHAGCKVTGFSDHNFKGSHKIIEGPKFLSKGPDFFKICNGRPCVRSYLVSCTQKMPDCVPQDKWSTLRSYDNSRSSLSRTFEYKYSIGTSWSNEMTEGFEISTTVSAEMTTSFWGLFEATLGVSATTGYNWGRTSTQAQDVLKESTISTEVPGGKIIRIQQTTGSCGGSDVSTEMFRTLEMMANGEFVEIK